MLLISSPPSRSRFDEAAACFYAAELVLALEYMSRAEVNVSHRDLKPENIMLDEHVSWFAILFRPLHALSLPSPSSLPLSLAL